MPKAKLKTKPKPPQKKAQKKLAAKRAPQRLRQHSPKQPPQKARPKMTDETNKTQDQERVKAAREPRGAGSGESAVHNRQRHDKNITSKGDSEPDYSNIPMPEGKSPEDYSPDSYKAGKEFPEGDATKGKPDFEAKARHPGTEQIPQRDYRAYLKDQAEKNEAANDEINAIAVENARVAAAGAGLLLDPDFQRDQSMQTTLGTMGGDIEAAKKRRDAAAAIRQAREEAALPGGKPKVA
jgi:hypothetical protein